ncbi:DUF11 domain-containing protein [Flavobacterium sp. MMS24-S5]|uniref:DUF11 domain-containing protein n=1 Tax=Flavobacterium sp. MMS24-S5 TaxID=3416605 RepID=UPI003CFF6C46
MMQKLFSLVSSADLSLTKNVVTGNTSPVVGSQVSFELKITNDGPNNATGVQVTDLLPTGFQYVNYSSSAGTYNSTSGIWNVGTVDVGVTEALILDAKVLPTGDYKNITQVTASNLPDPDSTPNNDDGDQSEDDEDNVVLTPTPPAADLSLTKSVSNTTPLVGSIVTFSIITTNHGPQDAALVQVTDLLPSGYTFSSFNATSGTYDSTTGLWTLDILESSESETLQINAIVNPTGDYTNIAEVTNSDTPDPNSTPNNGVPTENDYGTATTTPILQSSDLSLVKTVNNATPLVGSLVTFEVVITNNGPQDNFGVQVRDVLPSGYTFTGFTISTGTFDTATGVWTVGNLVAGDAETLQIVARVNPSGDYTNKAEVSAANLPDPDSTPNNGANTEDDYAEATTTPVPTSADLSLTKAVNNATPLVGSQVTFSIQVTNSGPQEANSVAVTDLLPSGYTYVSYSATTGSYDSSTGIWTVGNMPVSDSYTLQITATVNATGNYTNSAEITTSSQPNPDSTPNNGVTTEDDYAEAATTPTVQYSDLSLTKTVSDSSPIVDTEITFELIVTNNGSQDNTGVQVTDLLPAAFTFTAYTVSTGTYNPATGIWNIGNLPKNQSETLQIKAIANSIGNFANTAEVTAADLANPDSTPNNGALLEDDYAFALVGTRADTPPPPPVSDLSLTKTVNNATPLVGSQVTFEVVITNSGKDDNKGVQVTDLLPSGYTLTGYTISTGTYTPATGLWNVGNIVNGKSETLQIIATVNASGNYTNIAEVTAADYEDPDSTPNNGVTTEDDYATATVTPNAQAADLSLTKTVNNATPLIGTQVIFEVIATNNGHQNTTGVEVTDLLPSGYTFTNYSTTKGTYNPTTGKWAIGSFLNGDSQVLRITAVVNPTGDYVNIAEVTASNIPDPNSTPNNGIPTENDYAEIATTPVVPMADLSLTKAVVGGNISPIFGATVTFEITVKNSEAQNATGVKVIDMLPSGYEYVVYSSTAGQYFNTTGIWEIGNIPNGGSESLLIGAKVNTTGVYQNIAEVYASNELDPDSTPNNNVSGEDDISSVLLTPVPAVADLSIEKKVINNILNPAVGSQISFSITLTNSGSSNATGVIVKDVLPSGYDYIFYNSTSGAYNPATGEWTPGIILAGNSHTLILNVFVKAPTGTADEYLNIAEIMTADQHDPDSTPGNGIATEDDYDSISVTPVIVMADLSIKKTALNQDAIHEVGSTVIFTVTVTNDGPCRCIWCKSKRFASSWIHLSNK